MRSLRSARRLLELPGVVLATAAALGCGSGHKSPADGDPPPDAPLASDAASDAAAPDVLREFSDAVRAEFHLVVDGKLSDGRTRLLYAPRIAWLAGTDGSGLNPKLTRAEAQGLLVLNGTFSLVTPGVPALAREATAANIVLVRAALGMAHATCGATEVLSALVLGDCSKPPSKVDLPSGVAFSATANAAASAGAALRITPHLANGSAWDDVLVGDITWKTPGGDTLHTKLEVGCIGGFDTAGNAKVFDTAECKARYQP